MKKLFLGVLTALVGVSCCATACSSKKNSSDDDGNNEALANAARSLKATYGETIEDLDGRTDFEVPNTWNYGGVAYTVTWSASAATESEACPLALTVEDGVTFVDVNKLLSAETQYYLTATLTAPNGDTEEAKILGQVNPVAQQVSAKISGDPVANTEYVLSLYQAELQKTLYLNGEMSGYYFKTVENAEQAKTILVEENATTEDVTNDFFMYFMDEEAKTYLNVVPRDGSTTKVNVTFDAEPLSSWVYNANIGTMSTTTNDKTWFLGTFGTNYTISACESPKYDSNFKACLTTMTDRANVSDEVKVADTLNALSFDAVIAGVHTEKLARTGDVYPEATITWSLAEGTTAATLNNKGNRLTSIAVTEPAEITLTATVQSGDVTESKPFAIKVIPNEESAILAAAQALESGDSFINEVSLTGTVTKIVTAYDEKFGSVTFDMLVGEVTVEGYRVKGGAGISAADVAVGDTVTLQGILKNYNGTIEFDTGSLITTLVKGEAPENPEPSDSDSSESASESESGSNEIPETPAPTTPAEIVDAAYKLEVGASLEGTYSLTGTISSVDTAYSSSFNNITVTIKVEGKEDKPIKCFRLAGGSELKVGDVITVTGTLINFKGTVEFDAKCTYVLVSAAPETPEEGGDSSDSSESSSEVVDSSDSSESSSEVVDSSDSSESSSEVVDSSESSESSSEVVDSSESSESSSEVVDSSESSESSSEVVDSSESSESSSEVVDSSESSESSSETPAANTTVSLTISEEAAKQSWTVGGNSATKVESLVFDENISCSISGGANSGKVYTDGIRIYATDTPAGSITFTATNGHTIKTIKITTVEGDYAFLQIADDSTTDYSNMEITVNASSITINAVKNGTKGKQVRITAIEVVYA